MKFPSGPAPKMPDRYLGRPTIAQGDCPSGCQCCMEVCPVGALACESRFCLDMGQCLFCGECSLVCPTQRLRFTQDYRLAADSRAGLLVASEGDRKVLFLDAQRKRLFRRSLNLRQVSAGGCNACEADVNVLGTVGWDLSRFGINFVASPRHADGLLVTGPVSENMRQGLLKTYEAMPYPKLVIALGSCAISGGPFTGHKEVASGVDGMLPIDLYVPGCPPHPLTIFDGVLRLLGRIPE